MNLLKSLLFALLAIPLMGGLLLGAMVASGMAIAHYGAYSGFTTLIALILYGAVIGLPVAAVIQWLARKLV